MNNLAAAGERAQGGVDVLGEDGAVHFQILQQRRAPVAIGARKEGEAEEGSSPWVRDGVDFVKLDGDHAGQPGDFGVEDNAAALHDGGLFVGDEALHGPAGAVGVGVVVGVEDSNYVGVGLEGKEIVEVVGFGF